MTQLRGTKIDTVERGKITQQQQVEHQERRRKKKKNENLPAQPNLTRNWPSYRVYRLADLAKKIFMTNLSTLSDSRKRYCWA